MELLRLWDAKPEAEHLSEHIREGVSAYLARAATRQRLLGDLALRLLVIAVATVIAVLVIATASGVLKPNEFLSDPDTWFLVVLGASIASVMWTVWSWLQARSRSVL